MFVVDANNYPKPLGFQPVVDANIHPNHSVECPSLETLLLLVVVISSAPRRGNLSTAQGNALGMM